jgi:hypothetical protein
LQGLIKILRVGALATMLTGFAGAAAAQDRATLERCAARYAAAADLVGLKAKSDARFAAINLPPNAATLPLRERARQAEGKAVDQAQGLVAQNDVSINIINQTERWIEGVAKEGPSFAEAVFAGARKCDTDLGFTPVLDVMPATAAGEPPGWGQDATMICAVNYYLVAGATRRQDLLAKSSEALRRYATPKGLAPQAAITDLQTRARTLAAAPPRDMAARMAACDRSLGF